MVNIKAGEAKENHKEHIALHKLDSFEKENLKLVKLHEAVLLGKKGGAKRWLNSTKQQRRKFMAKVLKARWDKPRISKAIFKVKKTCERCGDEFETRQDHIKKGWGRFCSRNCSNKTIAKKGTKNRYLI